MKCGKGFNQWLYSYISLSLLFFLLVIRGLGYLELSIFFVNLLVGLVAILRVDGLQRFFINTPIKIYHYSYAVFLAMGCVYSLQFSSDYYIRAMLAAFIIIPTSLLCIKLLFTYSNSSHRQVTWMLSGGFVVYLLVYCFRLFHILQQVNPHPFDPDYFNLLYFFMVIPTEICGGIGFLLLNTIKINEELTASEKMLATTQEELKTLSGLLPICAHCKKIRDEKGQWKAIEAYISQHSEADFSHGVCESCRDEHYGDLYEAST
jgi:hypothetical protein